MNGIWFLIGRSTQGSERPGEVRGIARSVRDILAQRWVMTKTTYEQQNAKRIYYLSLEFLLGRSLANNITNLLLDPVAQHAIHEKGIRLDRIDRAGTRCRSGKRRLGPAGGVLPRLDGHDAPAGHGLWAALRIRHVSTVHSRTVGNKRTPTTGSARPDPWEIARPHEKVEVKLNCSFEVRGGTLQAIPGRPSSLIGIPFDRPVVGYGGKTINTLRLWAAAAPDYFDFQEFSTRRLRGGGGRNTGGGITHPGAVSRRFHQRGAGFALCAGVFPGRLLAG